MYNSTKPEKFKDIFTGDPKKLYQCFHMYLPKRKRNKPLKNDDAGLERWLTG